MEIKKKMVVMGPHILSLNLSNIQDVFFTSDLHLNHTKIIEYCHRPFKDTEEMNNILLNNLNNELSKVNHPILINCGDIIFSNVSTYDEQMDMIKADKIYNIIGNHDIKNILQRRQFIPYDENSRIYWSTELLVQILDDTNKNKILTQFTVSHYPHCSGQFFGSFNIHGHLHTPSDLDSYTGSDIDIARKLKETAITYDVGVDGNDYKPVKLTDILLGKLKNYQIKVIDTEKWNKILSN